MPFSHVSIGTEIANYSSVKMESWVASSDSDEEERECGLVLHFNTRKKD